MTVFRKMMCLIVLPTLVIYIVVLGIAGNEVYVLSRQEVQDDMTRLATNYAARFDGYLREAAMIAEVTARFMDTQPAQTEEQIFQQLRSNVERMPLVYGACMAFEPGAFKKDDSLFAPYVYRGPSGLKQMNIRRDVYDWYRDPAYTWFQSPKTANRAVWSKPYFDEGAGNVLMCTYSVPFYSGDEFRGVTTVDINLPHIQATVGKDIVQDLNFVILTRDGEFVYAPDASRIMHTTLFDVAEAEGRPDLAALGRRILKGEAGVDSIDGWDTPDRQWVFYAPIESTGWVFACRVPERTVLRDVWRRMTIGGVALGATLVLIVGCIFFVSKLITRPIARLNSKALEIAGGNLDARVEGVSGKDEIGQLGQSFNQMTAELRAHVERLAHEQAALEKIEKELDIARDIQRNLLPTQDPGLADFDIAGWSQAAEKTGGDYYDWQSLADGRIAISLADATGHGIGPAIVATVCRAYQRASFLNSGALSTLLGNIN
ncbi:MAG: HAMP domain-containing protein, partial [Planctomycetes bacterium]|nr:HAMP domain-containing protein [Planctomycetota bacterium]